MDTAKFLRYGILALLFSIPFIPLIIANGMFFPFIVGKNFTFRIIVELMAGGWVALMLLDRTYRPRYGALLGAFAAFVFAIGLADLLGENPWKSFWSNFERMEGFVTLLHLFAYFIVMASVLNTEKLWRSFWNTSVGVSVLLGLYGLLQLGGVIVINQGGVRLDATFGNATYLAIYMLFHIFITAWLALSHRGAAFVKYVYWAIILLQAFILYFTATRGAILGFLGGALLAGLLLALTMKGEAKVRKFAFGLVAAVVLIIGGFFLIRNTAFVHNNPVLSRMATISVEGGSARFMVWGIALQGIKERPILGWGQENFIYVFTKYYDPEMYAQEPWFDRVHDVFLDWLIAGGIIGLAAYLSIFGAALWGIWFSRRGKDAFTPLERSMLTGIFAGYFFHNLFVFDNIVSYILFATILAFIHHRLTTVASKDKDLKNTHAKASGMPVPIVVPVAIVCTLALVYLVNYKGIATNYALLAAISPSNAGAEANLVLFKKALAYNGLGGQEVNEQLLQAASSVARGNNVDPVVKADFIKTAKDAMNAELAWNASDARLQVFMGSFLNASGLPGEAKPYLEKAYELSPKKQAVLFELGNNALATQDFPGAFEWFKKAYELAPEYQDARFYYAASAVYVNRFDVVDQLLTAKYGTIAVDNDQLLNAYYQAKRFDLVVKIWEGRVAKDPSNLQFHVSLAASYLASGQRQEAIAELQKAIDLNASFKEQGEFFIKEIQAGRNP